MDINKRKIQNRIINEIFEKPFKFYFLKRRFKENNKLKDFQNWTNNKELAVTIIMREMAVFSFSVS
jgi:hypothetical protein